MIHYADASIDFAANKAGLLRIDVSAVKSADTYGRDDLPFPAREVLSDVVRACRELGLDVEAIVRSTDQSPEDDA